MKNILLISCLLIVTFSYTQDSLYSWNETFKVEENTISGWNVDAFGNLIVASSSSIRKFNSAGDLSYKISSKAFGEIKQIISITPFKLVLFSEQQQQICFLDNTLTPVDLCIDLGDFNIGFASLIGRSSRGGKLWVFDQVNSELLLIDLMKPGKIAQEIRNTQGLISLGDLVEILEFESDLHVLDTSGKLTICDLNGSLLSQNTLNCKGMSVSENRVWLRNEKEIFLLSDGEITSPFFQLPFNEIEHFRTFSDLFYFQFKDKISCLRLVKKK
ncbi:MAG: hypothetical protein FJX84_00490 [Bacteroidetes bacterium]|nr:hypothetical protein [Bacteroidota bacterium]